MATTAENLYSAIEKEIRTEREPAANRNQAWHENRS
jgi:hypothetical protein